MGKSPGKWIKTLLFGKKSLKSSVQKRRTSNSGSSKDGNVVKEHVLNTNSSVESDQIPSTNNVNGIKPKPHQCSSFDLASGLEKQQDSNRDSSLAISAPTDFKNSIEEKAAIKAQSAFRGYLARRAFYALKGIIRMQAFVRGHLTRRQARATLQCTWGIVKLQSLFRGSQARKNIYFDCRSSYRSKKVYPVDNSLAHKLVSSSISSKPLGFHYGAEEPNSANQWLDRWTCSVFWKPPQQMKKIPNSKLQGKRYAMETESGKSKRTAKKNLGSNATIESSLTSQSFDFSKPMRNLRKVSAYPSEISLSDPQSELERVKRNLRKVSEIELEKSVKNDSSLVLVNGSVNVTESNPLISANKEVSTEEEASEETLTLNSKRRASFSAIKPEYAENGVQQLNTPKLPSYMAATESVKARLRGQNSPRIGSEESEKTSFTRRHSLPSSVNGKVYSVSPRIQRPGLADGKGGQRNDRSIVSSRDVQDKLVRVEWKR